MLNYDDINNFIFSTKYHHEDLQKNAGCEHYKLLSYLTHQFNNAIIFDIGTHQGLSACALGSNKNNTIYFIIYIIRNNYIYI